MSSAGHSPSASCSYAATSEHTLGRIYSQWFLDLPQAKSNLLVHTTNKDGEMKTQKCAMYNKGSLCQVCTRYNHPSKKNLDLSHYAPSRQTENHYGTRVYWAHISCKAEKAKEVSSPWQIFNEVQFVNDSMICSSAQIECFDFMNKYRANSCTMPITHVLMRDAKWNWTGPIFA